MSDAARQNLKVSREGIVLIKSFEGFRPRAIRREDGGWIIGYGHTLSAREGATVSEGDAELLLRYDLLPVETSVNAAVPGDLNQHQFDALVSFAFSVGVDRFAGSDVRQRLAAGSPGEAADALMGWPEPALPEAALRRRAAERALFVADPAAPVALSDLLAAPLPPPAVVTPEPAPQVEAVVEPVVVEDAAPAPEAVVEAAPVEQAPAEEPATDTTSVDPRGAAVAALLGETADRIVQPDAPEAPIVEPFAPVEAETAQSIPVPSNDNPVEETASDEPPTTPVDEAPETPVEVSADAVEPEAVVEPVSEAPAPADEPTPEPSAPVEAADAPEPPAADAQSLNAHRYSPYGAMMVGPLPYLQPAADQDVAETDARTIDRVVVETAPVEPEPAPVETVEALAPIGAVSELTIQSTPVVYVAEPAAVDPAPVAELVLTPPEDGPELAVERPLWTPEQRDAPDGSETNLFGEDLTLTQGGSILRGDIEFEPPARFDWKETGPFIFMGGVGLVSFGASMAAFRRAAEQSGGGELTIIGWALALIGLACVGVSSINLYRRFGLPGGD